MATRAGVRAGRGAPAASLLRPRLLFLSPALRAALGQADLPPRGPQLCSALPSLWKQLHVPLTLPLCYLAILTSLLGPAED